MGKKTLVVIPTKCNGCGDCEVACAMKHTGLSDPARSRIRIMTSGAHNNFFMPSSCQQCEDPPCMAACPDEAIYRDEELNRVAIDYSRCVGCQMCVSACPFGAMSFNEDTGHPFKCDLCGGDPECVRACDVKAIDYVDFDQLHYPQLEESAIKLCCGAIRRKAA